MLKCSAQFPYDGRRNRLCERSWHLYASGRLAETTALKRAFGDAAYKLAVSSTKSMTGHLLSAAGGIEAVFTTLAVHNQIAPPTINLVNPAEGCDLD